VQYKSSDGTADAGEDYNALVGTLTFAPHTMTVLLAVNALADTFAGANEVYNLTLFNPVNATLGPQSTSTVTIFEPTNAIGTAPIGVDPSQGELVGNVYPLNGSFALTHPLDDSLNPSACGCSTLGGDLNATFRSDSDSPKPILQAVFGSDPSRGVPTSLTAQLTWNGTAQTAESFGLAGHSAGDVYLLDLQVANAVTATGVYPWSVTVSATFASGPSASKTISGVDPVVVNGSSGPLGPGRRFLRPELRRRRHVEEGLHRPG
jgi:hypothetical protein